jgi:hypothetical protein
MRQLVQQGFAFCARGHCLKDFTAQLAQLHKPRREIRRQLRVYFAPQPLRQRRTFSRRRNRNLQRASLYERTEEEVAQGWIIGGVAQDGAARGFFENSPIDFAIIGGRDDEIATMHVLWFEAARKPVDLSRGTQLLNARHGMGSDHTDRGAAAQKAFDFLQTDRSRTHHQAALPFQLQE